MATVATGRLGPDPLLERERELEHAEVALAAALEGEGSVLLVEGPAGMGKTRLAQTIAEVAASKGVTVHWATGDELERGFAFGVLRDLLASMLRGHDGADRDVVLDGPAAAAVRLLDSAASGVPQGVGADALTVDYGFYRLLHDLAERRPRLVCVDDAHWADLRSLHALRFAARRSGGQPVVILLTHRPPQDPGLTDLLGRFAAPPKGVRLVLSPLGARSVSLLAASAVPEGAAEALGRQLSTITGGNPFLVREMLAAVGVSSPGSPPATVVDIERLVPASIVESVQQRITVAGENAQQFADALAVLGEAPLSEVAGLAQLDEAGAVTAADRLAAAGVVSTRPSVRFAHPILRQAVKTRLPAARVSLMHAKAARLLSEAGAPLETVAAHLLEALPRRDPWAVTTLMAAARHQQRQGSPDTAVPLLARAAVEPPPPGQRFAVAFALAEAQAQTRHPEAVTTARRAVNLAAGPQQLSTARLQLARTLGLLGDFDAALDLLNDLMNAEADPDPEVTLQTEAELLGMARLHAHTHDRALARLDALAPRATPARSSSVVLLANLALSALERNEAPASVDALAEQALSQGWLLVAGSFQLVYAVTTLIWTDRLDAAERACDAALEAARASGSVPLELMARAWRSELNLRRGRVSDAAVDAQTYADLRFAEAPSDGTPYARAHLANVLIERAELDDAERALADPHPREHAGHNPFYLDSRGRLCLARGDPLAARDNLLACGRALAERGGVDTPTMFAWRSHAARALYRLGDRTRARQLAEEELTLATKGCVAGAIGEALTTLAMVEGGPDGVGRLHHAVDVLAHSPRVLLRVRALIELGAMLRRTGRPKDAREPLRAALALAHDHGAIALADQAREELVVSGARPRRAATTGLAALTPSEQRVAQLVARGHSNRQIADTLFVSPRTVATHLTHIYQKLQCEGRDELTTVLKHQPLTGNTHAPGTHTGCS